MGTISAALSLITGALEADQAALNVVANNVANANTAGYTEEKPNWRQNAPIDVAGILVGSGVTETGSSSQRDRVLLERLDQQQQSASASGSRLEALNGMQALFTPNAGLSSAAGDIATDITSFFNSFATLEGDPTNNALREQVLSSAATLAGDVSSAANSLNAQRVSLDQEAGSVVSQVNSLTSAIAQLNLQIQSASPKSDAGTLEDERQQDLSQLSQLVGINQITTENNGVSITTTSGQLLVSEGQNLQLSSGMVNGTTEFFLGGTDVTAQLASGGGQLGGYLTARDGDISAALGGLDQLAYGIATAVNAQNNAGVDLNGETGTAANPLNLFGEPAQVQGSAAAMSVVMTDPGQIAAAGAGNGTGDNSNAVAMADLAKQTVVNGQTPINSYSNFVSTLGATVAEVQMENSAQNASVTQLQAQNNALSKVNLNDEAAAMSLLETSYQAASQVFSILNSIMSSALNLGVETAVS